MEEEFSEIDAGRRKHNDFHLVRRWNLTARRSKERCLVVVPTGLSASAYSGDYSLVPPWRL